MKPRQTTPATDAIYRATQTTFLTTTEQGQRDEALAQATGEELTASMRQPLADISAKAGKLERDSPLFYGTGENPLLFGELPATVEALGWEPAPLWALEAKEADKQ